jgi:hypothetical protein
MLAGGSQLGKQGFPTNARLHASMLEIDGEASSHRARERGRGVWNHTLSMIQTPYLSFTLV